MCIQLLPLVGRVLHRRQHTTLPIRASISPILCRVTILLYLLSFIGLYLSINMVIVVDEFSKLLLTLSSG